MFIMYYLLLQIWILNAVYGSSQQNIDNDESMNRKRLLTNDPQVLSDKVLELERKLQEFFGRVTSVETENAQLKSIIKTTNSATEKIVKKVESQTSGGVVFIRWGRKDCPNLNGTQLVYTGLAGGGKYNENGGGTTYLCLPHDPDYAANDFPHGLEQSTYLAHVWGAEYQYSYGNVKVNDDVPCAACLDTRASTSMMIPGKSTCPTGWRKQFDGQLCANYIGHSLPSEYACVDDDPQYFEGRRQNLDGKLFYPAVTVCGSLPCPPYENAKYLACVVCSK